MKIAEEEAGCCCGNITTQETSGSEQADILILGPGCKNCQALEANMKEVLSKM